MSKGEILALMWLLFVVASVFILNSFGLGGTIAIFVLSIPLMAMSIAITSEDETTANNDAEDDISKRKRETLDTVLRDLSDDQLDILRQRLQNGTIDDDMLQDRIVGADGEFLHERK